MRILKFILFLFTLCLLVSATYGQGVTTFGALRPQDTSITKGQVKATALANSNPLKFVTVGPTGIFSLAIPPGGGNADSFTFFTNYRADTMRFNIYTLMFQRVTYSDTASMLSPYLKKSDSGLYTTRYRLDHYIDSAFEALDDSTFAVRTELSANLEDTAAAIRSDLNNKVNYSDTAAMLATYLRKNDSSLYQTKYRTDTMRGNIYAALDTKGSGSVTSAAVANTYGLNWTGSPITTTGTLTPTIDTGLLATRLRVQKAVDSLNVIIGTKGSGTVTSVTFAAGSGVSLTGTTNVTTTGTVTISAEVTASNVVTLSGKRINPRVSSATSYTTSVTIDGDNYDNFSITALNGALLFNAPSGTPTDGQVLIIRVRDNGTARALTWNAIFAGTSLPTTTTISTTKVIALMYNSALTKWECLWSKDV